MIRVHLPLVVLTLVCAGCVDSWDTEMREYRNTNNEVIDAMMMVTSESQAEGMTARVFKPMGERYEAIDKKLGILVIGAAKKDIVKEVFESDGVHMYLTELEVNRQRFALEMTRLRNLRQQILDAEMAELKRQGDANPKVDAQKICPKLDDLVSNGDTLRKIREQLGPKAPLLDLMNQFGTWKQVQTFPEMVVEFKKRRELFESKKPVILVQP
jgi:hypothetical protein